MPSQHKDTKRGMSFREEPEVLENLKELARLNGTDFTGLMRMLAKGKPVCFPDGSSVYKTTPKGEH